MAEDWAVFTQEPEDSWMEFFDSLEEAEAATDKLIKKLDAKDVDYTITIFKLHQEITRKKLHFHKEE